VGAFVLETLKQLFHRCRIYAEVLGGNIIQVAMDGTMTAEAAHEKTA
jgi:hypothetical protein